MDYEKAYKEALERAKSLIDKKGLSEGSYPNRNACEAIFPELTESEDERIRKAIIDYILYETKLDEATEHNWVAYLEKQKDIKLLSWRAVDECEGIPDGHYVVVAYNSPGVFELDTVFNGKLSHPNRGNLKATGVFYIPNADENCMCIIEKQKLDYCHHEVDLSGCSEEYSKGYYDGWNNCNQQHSQLEAEQIPFADSDIKPHKGDDNNPYDMRLYEAQEYAIKRGFDIPFNDGEVYVDERHMAQTIGNIIRWADEHPKEQKPYIEICPHSIKSKSYSEQKSIEKQDYSGLTDFERAIHRGFLCAGVENVPVEIIKETAQDCLARIEQKPAERINITEMVAKYRATDEYIEGEYKGKPANCMIRAYEQGIRDTLLKVKEQKPAEWTEDDEEHLKWLCRIIHSRKVHGELSLKEESELGQWIDRWINHSPQPKWDEFDEDCLKRAIWYVENPAPSVVKDTNLALWLKSLRPQSSWKPSKEQMEALNTLLCRGDFSYVGQVTKLQELYIELKKL